MKEILKTISRSEWRFVLLVAIILALITTAPTIYGFLIKPENKFFPALRSTGPGDYLVYYSYLDQAKAGAMIFKDLFTSEAHSPFIFNPLWLIVGTIGKIFHLSSLVNFQIARAVAIFPFAMVLYFFISYFIKNIVLRKCCFLFSFLATGLGGFAIPIIRGFVGKSPAMSQTPMDLWVSESGNFLTIFHSAHFIVALTLIILIFLLMLLAFEKNRWLYVFYSGMFGLFLLFFHPFHLPTLLAVPLVYTVVISFMQWRIQWSYLKKYLIFILLIAPAVVYQFMLLIYNPVAIGRADENICLTPYFWVVLISYGLVLPLSIWGALKINKENKYIFLISWLIAHFLLIFSPLQYQRRLTQGLQIPMTIMAFLGIYFLYETIKRKWSFNLSKYSILIVMVMTVLFCFSNIYVFAENLMMYTDPEFRSYPHYVFLDQPHGEAFKWLKNNLNENDVVLSSTTTGSFIAGFAAKRIYVGHWAETLNWREKLRRSRWFYGDNSNDTEKSLFLKREGIDYLYYSQFEQAYGDFKPGEKDYLTPVFSQGNLTIYRVL